MSMLSHVWLFETPWTVAHQAPLSMEFSRQEYRSELPFPFLGDLPSPGIESMSLVSLTLQAGSLLIVTPGKPMRRNRPTQERRSNENRDSNWGDAATMHETPRQFGNPRSKGRDMEQMFLN